MRLTSREARLYDCLVLDQDRAIEYLHAQVFPGKDGAGMTLRRKQQELGSVISSLNGKLSGQRIVPGEARRTYTLQSA